MYNTSTDHSRYEQLLKFLKSQLHVIWTTPAFMIHIIDRNIWIMVSLFIFEYDRTMNDNY